VQVQKGEVTAEFAAILGVREKYKPKNRDKHTHHTVDALILSLIPDSARLKSILEKNAETDELTKYNEYSDADTRSINHRRVELLKDEIQQLLIECRIPMNSLYKAVQQIEQKTIVIAKSRDKDKIFSTAKKMIKKGKLKGKYATGDLVRGQLHKESFYGKIQLVERDEEGKPKRNENGEWIWQKDKNGNKEFAFVKKVDVGELLKIENIVDPEIRKIFEQKVKEKPLKEMQKEGGLFYSHPKTGKIIRIRHVRCFQKPTELLEIKNQTYPSVHDYKNNYYADNAENLFYALYEDEKGNRTFEMLNLFNAIKIKQTNPVNKPEDFFALEKEVGRGKNRAKAKLKAIFFKNISVIFYQKNIDELKYITKDEASKRLYFIYKFKKDGRLYLQHHLEARPDKELGDGPSLINFDELESRYFISKDYFNFAIEGKDFEINPDGEIFWKF
jgi:CRISPR-associated endonuclease Csn1